MPNSYFDTDERRKQLELAKQRESAQALNELPTVAGAYFGTVGAVALDAQGHIAAATSTGGMTNKIWSRIGDSPVIGAGTWADERCGVSGTGWGEFFIRNAVAHDICARVAYRGDTLAGRGRRGDHEARARTRRRRRRDRAGRARQHRDAVQHLRHVPRLDQARRLARHRDLPRHRAEAIRKRTARGAACMDLPDYRTLRAQARRLARSAEDADDLVQDALIAALESRRCDLPWLSGTLRNLVAMQARSAVRRRRREAAVSGEASAPVEAAPACDAQQLLRPMPPAARRVALLALHGLGGDEIRWILGLSATAFRQRLTSIRKSLGTLPPALRAETLALAYVRDPSRSVDLQFGLVRRALKAALGGEAGLGTHDADGHLLILRPSAHTRPPGGNE